MKSIVLAAPLLVAASALPAFSVEFGNGFTATGVFELEYLKPSGDSGQTLGYGTADIGYNQKSPGFGGFVGFDAFSIDDESEIAVYGALSFSGDFGRVQVGVPRAVIDEYFDTPKLGGSRLYDLELSSLTSSIVTASYLLDEIDSPVGLRYDGTFGDLKVGTSFHRIEELDVVDIAAIYQMGSTELRAGLEHISDGSDNATSYFLGAEGAFGPVKAGLQWTSVADSGDLHAAQLYAVYSPMEKLNLTGTILSVDSGSGFDTAYGVSADYSFAQGVFVEAGIIDGTQLDTAIDLTMGVKF